MSREEKNKKRDRDQLSPKEEEIFKRSKHTTRTPEKKQGENVGKEKQNMEELKVMLDTWCKELKKEMRENNEEQRKNCAEQIREELQDFRKQMKKQSKELGEQVQLMQKEREEWKKEREEWKKEREDWKEEKEKLQKQVRDCVRKLERNEREKREKNIVVRGIEIKAKNEEGMKEEIEKMMEEKMQTNINVKKANKLAEKVFLVRLEKEEDKGRVMRNKRLLKEHKYL